MSDFPVTIYHASTCLTSRNTLGLIRACGYEPTVTNCLEVGWTAESIAAVLKALGDVPLKHILCTQNGSPARELGLLTEGLSDSVLLAAMLKEPLLVNRPIVVTPLGAKLCRPAEMVLSLLKRGPSEPFAKEDGTIVDPLAVVVPESRAIIYGATSSASCKLHRPDKNAMTYEAAVESVAPTSAAISHYYSEVVQKSEDLKTNACCTAEKIPPKIRAALKLVHPSVIAKYYGCGLVFPASLSGLSVLDLGCGAGRDVYLLSFFVGSSGRVVGVDCTPEQLAVATAALPWHESQGGHVNVSFVDSHIERMDGLPSETFDVVVSNCVVNLSPNKRAVLREAYRLLKPGGELYFSDVYCDRRQSPKAKLDPELWGECLSGALYWNDFLRVAKECGFLDPRLVKDSPITVENASVEAKLGPMSFFSATYRLFKIPELEPDCEDYGQAVIYKGTVEGCEHFFDLDGHHRIFKGKVFPVCGNTWRMLKDTRFAQHFDFIGDFSKHFGIFEGCGKNMPFSSSSSAGSKSSCC